MVLVFLPFVMLFVFGAAAIGEQGPMLLLGIMATVITFFSLLAAIAFVSYQVKRLMSRTDREQMELV